MKNGLKRTVSMTLRYGLTVVAYEIFMASRHKKREEAEAKKKGLLIGRQNQGY